MNRTKRILLGVGAAIWAVTPILADDAAWDFSNNDQQKWVASRNLAAEANGGCLSLDITGTDSSIGNNAVSFDPKKLTVFQLRYRASGLPPETTGQLFFTGDGAPDFNGDNYWFIPSLVSDGQWHDIKLSAAVNIKTGLGAWTGFNRITKLRLDMVDQFPGKIEIKYIKFTAAE